MQVLFERIRLPTWKACNWSHDQKYECRGCWKCGSLEHMAPACTRLKERGDVSPTNPEIRKIEREDLLFTSSKIEENEGSIEGPSMKELLEKTNTLLKSLTTTAVSSKATGSTTDSRKRSGTTPGPIGSAEIQNL